MLVRLKKKLYNLFESIGNFTVFSFQATYMIFKPPLRFSLIIKELTQVGLASIVVVSLSNLAIGMVIALQMAVELAKFNAQVFTANILAQSLAREMCPLITAFMLTAKNGSAFTAEIGAMNINDQINALQTMSVNPVQYLVTPRLIAFSIMSPVLTGLANLFGLIGGYIIMFGLIKLEYASTVDWMFKQLEPADIISGIAKSYIMGCVTCLICCYYGFNAKRGSSGVGAATTSAVVISYITILIIDLILGQIFLLIGVTS